MTRAVPPWAFVLLLLAGCEQAPLVRDEAGLLTKEQAQTLELHHQYLLLDHDIDYRVVTVRGTENIDRAANSRFQEIGTGSLSRNGRGLMLMLDPDLQQVRLEVGYTLEGTFPDAFVAYVEQRQMVPFFVAGRISDGILASTELIIDRAQRAQRNASWDDEIWMEGSGGAGARASTRSAPEFRTSAPTPDRSMPTPAMRAPEDVVALYLDAMQRRDNDPELDIYTAASTKMLKKWLVTPAQMDQVAKTYSACHRARTIQRGDRAVIRYPIPQRACAPWFLQRGAGGWQLDLTMLQTTIRFGRSNAWHFDQTKANSYAFAFEDWEFDSHGFPVRRSTDD